MRPRGLRAAVLGNPVTYIRPSDVRKGESDALPSLLVAQDPPGVVSDVTRPVRGMRDDVDVVRRPGQPDHAADGNHVDDATGASERAGPLDETGKEGAMPGKRPSVKNEKEYEALKEKGMSKERAARIANSPGASSHGGKKSHSKSRSGSSKQGGTAAQKKAAGRKGGKATARRST